jgi:replication factor A1
VVWKQHGVCRDGVDRFFDLLQPERVYLLSGGKVKTANKQFSSVNNDYELNFDEKATVVECGGESDLSHH